MADAEQTLRNLLDKELDARGYKPRDVKLESINSGGANYTSKIFLVDVDSPNKEHLKLFSKVATINENMRDTMCADWLFATERLTYTKIAKVFDDLQRKYEVPEEDKLKFPKFYGCCSEYGKETVILENLVASGYKSFNRFKPMDWEHACACVEYIAKFHALSFAYAKDHPKEFKELTSGMRYELGAKERDEELMRSTWISIINSALGVLKDDQKARVMAYLQTKPKLNTYSEPIDRPVIVHGDFRLSNLLFKKTEDKLNAIAVDFQTVYAGRPPADLVYLIFLGSEEEFRAKHFDDLMDFYYTSLCKMTSKLSVDPTEVYPREQFDKDLKETLKFAILIGATILPTVVVEEELVPDLEDFNYNNFINSPNELFAKRFSGIVNDCIRWNII